MGLVDEAKVYLKAGNGGDGCVSFRREKFIEFGGPDGGNGGRGGNVIFVSVNDINTLLYFRYKQHIKAENGHSGSGCNKSGASGQDVVVKIPIGTQIYEEDGKTLIADLDSDNQKEVIAKGGRGGVGNAQYKSSTNRAPRYSKKGQEGEEKYIWLKLKIISDVGIIGLPNSGKSTFLSRCTRSRTKVADYPFTTLEPFLGVACVNDQGLVLADIPGLIENAHLGVGLGHKFLKHIERCRVLLHLVDCSSDDVVGSYKCVRNELMLYNSELCNKKEFVVLSRCDLLSGEEVKVKQSLLSQYIDKEVLLLSFDRDTYYVLNVLSEYIKQENDKGTQPLLYDPYNVK